MPCCTYLSNDDYLIPTTDKEINELLQKVCTATQNDWRVSEYIYEIPRWFRQTKIIKEYTLYNHISGPEYQVINFYYPDKDWSINTSNNAGLIVAYLYGILAGIQQSKRRYK